MSKQKLSGKGLVIQFTADELRVAKTTLGVPAPELIHVATAPLPRGAVEDGMLRQSEQIQEILKDLLEDPEFKHVTQTILVLSTSQVIMETTSTPNMPEKRMGAMLETNMDLYFPLNPQDYRLVWKNVGPGTKSGEAEVRLWAVPRSILAPYYSIVNGCGLNVAAVDFFGDALVSAASLSYGAAAGGTGAKGRGKLALTAGKKQAEPAPAPEEAPADSGENNDTTLYLCAEQEQILMTFAAEGRVRLQRVLLWSGDYRHAMDEIGIVMDYYASLHTGYVGSVVLTGALTNDSALADALDAAFGLPVRALPCAAGPEWSLCQGAARGSLDFGDPSLNKVLTAAQQLGTGWHYILVALGGAALIASVVLLLGSQTVWNNTLSGLRARDQTLQLQAAQTSAEAARVEEEAQVYQGYANNYSRYQNKYLNYSLDWELLFNSLRTYNDNLKLALNELETVLPTTTSVTRIYIHDSGLYLQFACPDKAEAAYIYTQLRGLQYATLTGTSNLTVGPPGDNWLNDLHSTSGVKLEAPPESGSSVDPATLLALLQNSSLNIPSEIVPIAAKALAGEDLTANELLTVYSALNAEQRDMLVDLFAAQLAAQPDARSLNDLMKTATLKQRQNAITDMVENDPAADYRFLELFQEDLERDQDDKLLFQWIILDLMQNGEAFKGIASLGKEGATPDPEALQAALPEIAKVLRGEGSYSLMKGQTADVVNGTEALIRTDTAMTQIYAYHLGVAMGEVKAIKPSQLVSAELLQVFGINITPTTPPTTTPTPTPSGSPTPTPTRKPTDDPTPTPSGSPAPTTTPSDPNEMMDWAMKFIVENYQYFTQDELQELSKLIETPEKITPELVTTLLTTLNARKAAAESAASVNEENKQDASDMKSWLLQYVTDNSQYLYEDEIQALMQFVQNPDQITTDLVQRLMATVNARKNAARNQGGTGTGTGGGGGGGGNAEPVGPADDRVFFTVILGYKSDLINAELERKGLSRDDKIEALEVGE